MYLELQQTRCADSPPAREKRTVMSRPARCGHRGGLGHRSGHLGRSRREGVQRRSRPTWTRSRRHAPPSGVAQQGSYLLDVTDSEGIAEAFGRIVERHGAPFVCVSNAGVSKMRPFLDITPEELDFTLGVNLRGLFLTSQAAARAMVEAGRGGCIVNIASMAGKQGRVPFLADYVASKFGVVGLTQAMAFELAKYGIRVNSVCPGYVATPMQERELAWEAELRDTTIEEVRRALPRRHPAGATRAARGRRSGRRLPGRPRLRVHHGRVHRRERRGVHGLRITETAADPGATVRAMRPGLAVSGGTGRTQRVWALRPRKERQGNGHQAAEGARLHLPRRLQQRRDRHDHRHRRSSSSSSAPVASQHHCSQTRRSS